MFADIRNLPKVFHSHYFFKNYSIKILFPHIYSFNNGYTLSTCNYHQVPKHSSSIFYWHFGKIIYDSFYCSGYSLSGPLSYHFFKIKIFTLLNRRISSRKVCENYFTQIVVWKYFSQKVERTTVLFSSDILSSVLLTCAENTEKKILSQENSYSKFKNKILMD